MKRNSVTRFLGEGDTVAARIGSIVVKTLSQLTYGPTTLPQILRYLRYVWTDPRPTSTFFHLATNHRPSKMNRNIALAIATVLILALSTVYAEVIHWTSCPSDGEYN